MSKPVCYMGIYNEHDIRDMHTVVVRYVTDFKSNPDRVIPLYEHPPVPTERRVPEGWKLVPIEPTEQQLFLAYQAQSEATLDGIRSIYEAMLNAAPKGEV